MRRVDVIINCYVGKGLGLTKGVGFFSHYSSFFLCYSALLFYGFFCSF